MQSFHRITRREKNVFLDEQCKEREEKNRMGKTRDLFQENWSYKETFHARMGMIKDRKLKDLIAAEEIKKWQEYTEELYKKGLNIPDNHNGVVTHLELGILACEVGGF